MTTAVELNVDDDLIGLAYEERLRDVARVFEQVKQDTGDDYSYQLPHIRTLVRAVMKHGNGLDTSDTGTGKTFTATAAAYVMGLDLFVICPISVRPDWKYAAELLNVRLIDVLNYEIIRTGTTPYVTRHKETNSKGKARYWFEWHPQILDPTRTLVVFDEVHRCKDYKTQNAEVALASIDASYQCLLQSATAADNPMHMKVVALATGCIRRPQDFFGWMLAHGVAKEPVYGYSKRGKARGPRVLKFVGGDIILNKIHKRLFPEHGGRMRIKDLGDKFPATQILWLPYEMPAATEAIAKVYAEMRKELAKLRATKAKDRSTLAVTIKLRARQEVELLKVPYFVEIAEQGKEDGYSVIVFVNFEATLIALAARLGTQNLIHGISDFDHREQVRTEFNADREPYCLANIKCGGEALGLGGKRGGKTRLVIISPNYSGLNMKQALGRAPRGGGCPSIQKIIFAADTVEEEACEKVKQVMHHIDVFNEGADWSAVDAALDIE